jgi:hypothetical protein
MNKKKYLYCFLTVIVACIVILIISFNYDSHKTNKNEAIISEVDLKTVDDLIIGSDPPKLLYADKDKVIFNCRGVYVYDIKNKVITQSFDISSFMSGKYSKLLSECFSLQGGKQLVFGFFKVAGSLVAAYSYSFENNLIKELTEKEYKDCLEKRFECMYLNYNDELYQKSSGMVANISDNEYVYLTFQDWKVSTINIVYVNDDTETHYRVFENN